MTKHGTKTRNAHILNGHEDYFEDMDCHLCKYWRGTRGCSRTVCCCEEEYADAQRRGKRKKDRGRKK